MKICMFTNTYLPHVGGVARSVERFSADLRDMGHDVLVVAPVFPGTASGESEDGVLRVPAIQNFNGSDFSVRITLPFLISTRIGEFRPDIIHSHHPYLLGDAALHMARRRECPLLFTHHTLYEKYTHYVPLDSETLKRFVIHLSSRYANFCDGVAAPSRSLAELITKRGVTAPIREIPTGVELEYFQSGRGARFRNVHGIPPGTPVVGHVGRLAPEKNLGFLARAAAAFLKERDSLFLVIGAGPAGEEIRRVFEKEHTADRLFLAGEKTGQDLADGYAAMDIFAFASKTETQGMVLVEAMAAGKPVIALDASGTREVVTDGRNGRLLKEDTPAAAYAGALKDFFDDPEKTVSWREEAVNTAREFSRETCARRLLGFYEETLAAYSPERVASAEFMNWENLLRALTAEWDLLAEKAGALVDSFGKNASR